MYINRARYLLAGVALAATGGVAHAQATPTTGTTAGTVVSNQASASFTVNGTPGTAQSNVSTFVVDRKVNLTLVTEQTSNTQVNLGQTGAVTSYRLTNLTNGTQDFLLDPDQQNLSLGVLPGTDNFDVSGMTAYVDANNNGTYEPATDTATFVDELAPDASVVIFIVATVPNQANANLAFVSLHTTVAAGGAAGTKGAALAATDLNLIDQANDLDIVFADGDSDGVYLGDIARNGQARAYAAYEVGTRSVDLSVVKSSRVLSDGVNLANFRSLPGAVVEYCLVARNATLLTPATNVTLTDQIPTNTTYVPGSIQVGALGGLTSCLVGGVPEDDDTDDAAEIDPYRGSFNTGNSTVTAVVPTLLGGTSIAVSFRVTIN